MMEVEKASGARGLSYGAGDSNSRQLNRGQVKVTLETDGDKVIVQVLEARHLQIKGSRSKSQIFTQVGILGPGDHSDVPQQSQPLSFSSTPIFETTFTLHAADAAERGRLVISVWTITSGSVQFVGSMSFGVRHLVSKCSHQGAAVGGWYYLLSGQLGNRKHLLAQPLDTQCKGSGTVRSTVGDSSSTLHGTHSQTSDHSSTASLFTVSLPKIPTGYGFTVQGSCPAKIGHVKVKGSAYACGLRSGDHVIKVNGEDVSRSLASHVASLVRNSQHLDLELHRPATQVTTATSQQSAHVTALTPGRTHNNTYETLHHAASSPKVGCIMLNNKKHKNSEKLKGRKTKRSLNCMFGAKHPMPVYKALQNENVPPSASSILKQRLPTMTSTDDLKVADKVMEHTRSPTQSLSSYKKMLNHSSRLLLSCGDHNTPKSRPLREKYCAGANTPTSYLESQMQAAVGSGNKGLEIHRWLDSVAQETGSLLRKDGSYSHTSTSPEVSSEQTALQVTTNTSCSRSSTHKSPLSSPNTDQSAASSRDAKMVSDNYLRWDPGISVIENSFEGLHFMEDCDGGVNVTEASEHNDSAFQSEFENAYINEDVEEDERALLPPSMSCDTPGVVGEENSVMVQDASRVALIHSLPELLSDVTSCQADTEDSYEDEVSLMPSPSLSQLIECEAGFVRCMQWGVGRYSRPLRHAHLAPAHHKAVFQNIEKLVTLSQFHLQQLLNSHDLDFDLDSLSATLAVYRPRLKIVCEAYDHYLSGFADAVTLLHKLCEGHGEFRKFVSCEDDLDLADEDADKMSIEQFIQMPLKHLQDLVRSLRACGQELTRGQHCTGADVEAFTHILTDLEIVWQKWTPTDQADRHCFDPRSAGVKVQPPTVPPPAARGVDAQILQLQQRLLAGSKFTGPELATPNRHMVFSSQLLLLEGSTSIPVTAWLLSDMLLLTRSGVKDTLILADDPIMLQDIVSCELGCDHSCELLVYSQREASRHRSHSVPLSCHRLRVLSPEQRHAWLSILEHRLNMA